MKKKRNVKVKKDVQHPCKNCKYYNACGDTSRTARCEGREYKS